MSQMLLSYLLRNMLLILSDAKQTRRSVGPQSLDRKHQRPITKVYLEEKEEEASHKVNIVSPTQKQVAPGETCQDPPWTRNIAVVTKLTYLSHPHQHHCTLTQHILSTHLRIQGKSWSKCIKFSQENATRTPSLAHVQRTTDVSAGRDVGPNSLQSSTTHPVNVNNTGILIHSATLTDSHSAIFDKTSVSIYTDVICVRKNALTCQNKVLVDVENVILEQGPEKWSICEARSILALQDDNSQKMQCFCALHSHKTSKQITVIINRAVHSRISKQTREKVKI